MRLQPWQNMFQVSVNLNSLVQHVIQIKNGIITHPARRRRGDVAATSLDTSQWRRKEVSNETPNFVSVVRREDVSLVRLHDVIEERRYDVSRLGP